MLKPPVARIPEIKVDLINRPDGELDCIYEADVEKMQTFVLI